MRLVGAIKVCERRGVRHRSCVGRSCVGPRVGSNQLQPSTKSPGLRTHGVIIIYFTSLSLPRVLLVPSAVPSVGLVDLLESRHAYGL
eukprot:SAG11_NODE_2704_length_3073_cov_4.296907_2_plen_87_part_00